MPTVPTPETPVACDWCTAPPVVVYPNIAICRTHLPDEPDYGPGSSGYRAARRAARKANGGVK
ncbi:hypothetical protein ACG83_41410 [Frankia sp. R43]|uniref:hypothetical protein n=1 Tax=Frankia sp. R43 TaxID=269536 RepID=UPI0006CA38BE|nr:hypothetical protein [Frankia sp. R43]KPM50238.1 hypothetical protein ACG83_41410 [Frankia sp. R43]